jgi:lipoate-protein ligase A
MRTAALDRAAGVSATGVSATAMSAGGVSPTGVPAAERVVAPAGATSFAERGAAPRLHWRLLCDEPLTGARNMALDHALAVSLGEGTAVLRLYRWSRPTVSFGRHEPARDVYDRTLGAALGLDFVRRSTGGGAVLHEGELTYAVVVPLRALGGPRTAYRRINEALAAGLRTLGADVAVSEHGLVRRPGAGPCFQAAAPGEIVARGRKLVGSAQARVGGALLQHGAIAPRADQSVLAELTRRGAPAAPAPLTATAGRTAPAGATAPDTPTARTAPAAATAPGTPTAPAAPRPPARGSHALLAHHVSIDEVAGAVAMSVRLTLGGVWEEGEYQEFELREAERLESAIYGRESWTWRR